MTKKHNELTLLVSMIDHAYRERAWHGPNLRGSLRGLSAEQAAWRPAPSRHNIWEIAVHAAYWKYAVWRRLVGEKRGSFPLEGSNWFRLPVAADEKSWRSHLALLEKEHRQLRQTVEEMRVSQLYESSAGSGQRNVTLIWGIAAHDIYHAGQIQLLKRLQD